MQCQPSHPFTVAQAGCIVCAYADMIWEQASRKKEYSCTRSCSDPMCAVVSWGFQPASQLSSARRRSPPHCGEDSPPDKSQSESTNAEAGNPQSTAQHSAADSLSVSGDGKTDVGGVVVACGEIGEIESGEWTRRFGACWEAGVKKAAELVS